METITYSSHISALIEGLTELRDEEGRSPAARELSLAITHLEDAQMRINRAGVLRKGQPLEPADEL